MAYEIAKDKCIACGACVDACPADAIQTGETFSIDPLLCMECGACSDACPEGAPAAA